MNIKTCPICGNKAGCADKLIDDPERNPTGAAFYAVFCLLCFTEGPMRLSEDEAIAAWNTRVSPDVDRTPVAWSVAYGQEWADGYEGWRSSDIIWDKRPSRDDLILGWSGTGELVEVIGGNEKETA